MPIFYTSEGWDSRGVDTRVPPGLRLHVFVTKLSTSKEELVHHIGRVNRQQDLGTAHHLSEPYDFKARNLREVERQLLLMRAEKAGSKSAATARDLKQKRTATGPFTTRGPQMKEG